LPGAGVTVVARLDWLASASMCATAWFAEPRIRGGLAMK
jgi:hypothetical protein